MLFELVLRSNAGVSAGDGGCRVRRTWWVRGVNGIAGEVGSEV